LLKATPNWCAPEQCRIEPVLLHWLLDGGSLTRRLTHLAAGDFFVQPLQEGWQSLRGDECTALGVAPESIGWVREVYLQGGGRPWIFARSVAAQTALLASGFDFSQLGSRSLGELLFCQQDFIRGEIELCRYPPPLLPPEVRSAGLWGRRSCFYRGVPVVMVAEIWLPELLDKIMQTTRIAVYPPT